jgi:hypothetical protein
MGSRLARFTTTQGQRIIINLDRITQVLPQTHSDDDHFCRVTFEKDHHVALRITFDELENLLIVE